MRNLILILLLLVAEISVSQTGIVTKVSDGDTFTVLCANGQQMTIRLAGVDCPEKAQTFGSAARVFTAYEVVQKNVKIKRVSTTSTGIVTAWIYYGNKFEKDLSRELLRAGLTWHDTETDNTVALQEMEDVARAKKIGLWGLPDPERPSKYRKHKKAKR